MNASSISKDRSGRVLARSRLRTTRSTLTDGGKGSADADSVDAKSVADADSAKPRAAVPEDEGTYVVSVKSDNDDNADEPVYETGGRDRGAPSFAGRKPKRNRSSGPKLGPSSESCDKRMATRHESNGEEGSFSEQIVDK